MQALERPQYTQESNKFSQKQAYKREAKKARIFLRKIKGQRCCKEGTSALQRQYRVGVTEVQLCVRGTVGALVLGK